MLAFPAPMTDRRMKQKVLLLGDGAVGKTSLIRKFVLDTFSDDYITTIGTKVTKKELEVKSGPDKVTFTLLIWDVLGQKGYTSVQRTAYTGAKGVIFICDLSRKETLNSLREYWLPEVAGAITAGFSAVVVGNKNDLPDPEITEADLAAFAEDLGTPHFTSSAKTGEHVEEMFATLAAEMVAEHAIKDTKIPAPAVVVADGRNDLVSALDAILADFSDQYGDQDMAMATIRHQLGRLKVDIKTPTKEGIIKVIDALRGVEESMMTQDRVRKNRFSRRKILGIQDSI